MQVRQPVFRLISNIDVKNWRATFCLDYVPPGFNLWPRREAKIPHFRRQPFLARPSDSNVDQRFEYREFERGSTFPFNA